MSNKEFICPVCGKRIKYYPAFVKHLHQHINYNTCPVCRKQFKSFRHLLQHFASASNKDYAHRVFSLIVRNGSKAKRSARILLFDKVFDDDMDIDTYDNSEN